MNNILSRRVIEIIQRQGGFVYTKQFLSFEEKQGVQISHTIAK